MRHELIDLITALAGIAAIWLGVRVWVDAESQAARFRARASENYGDRVGQRFYSVASVRVGAAGAVIVGMGIVLLTAFGQFS